MSRIYESLDSVSIPEKYALRGDEIIEIVDRRANDKSRIAVDAFRLGFLRGRCERKKHCKPRAKLTPGQEELEAYRRAVKYYIDQCSSVHGLRVMRSFVSKIAAKELEGQIHEN